MSMPKPNKFILVYGASEYECTPNNWDEIELGLSRDDNFGINKEITTDLTFSGKVANIFTALYNLSGFSAICTLNYYKRQNDFTYKLFRSLSANFTTYSRKNNIVTISFIENTIQKSIDNNKSIQYDFILPSDLKLNYQGVNIDKSNGITALASSLSNFSSSTWYIPGDHSTVSSSSQFEFTPIGSEIEYNKIFCRSVLANTSNITTKIGEISFLMSYPSYRTFDINTSIKLIRFDLNSNWLQEIATFNLSDYSIHPYYGYNTVLVSFKNNTEYSYDISFNSMNMLGLMLHTGSCLMTSGYVVENTGNDCYLKIKSSEPSKFNNRWINVVSHEWAINKLLEKINPNAILQYNLPKYNERNSWIPVLSSGTGISRSNNQIITLKFDDIVKSLRCLYGAGYKIDNNTIIFDYIENLFINEEGIEITPIQSPKISASTDHVFNKIDVGYETDDDVANGQLEFNCKNTFTINSKVNEENTLDLVHPYKAGMYTIEQYMNDKNNDSTETKESDTDIFIFAVRPFYQSGITNITEFYNNTDYLIPTAYNAPISPMHMLLANGRYLGISSYNGLVKLIFSSTERTANANTTCAFDSYDVYENGDIQDGLISLMSNPIFLPIEIEVNSSLRLWDMDYINQNLYKYLKILDKNTNTEYKMYIFDVTLQMTKINSQTFVGFKVL